MAARVVPRPTAFPIDWGALVKGYCSDLTRTLMVGRVSPKMKQIYKVVHEAQLAAISGTDWTLPDTSRRA